MAQKRVMITGLGIISPNGIGKDAFSEAIFQGISGIRPVSLFDTDGLAAKTSGEIKDFKPEEFLGAKGLRLLDRSTKLVNSAAKLALDDAGLEISDENNQQAGVVIGNTLGSLRSIMDFDKAALEDGARYVNPGLFPNTVINSPASQISIRFNIKGFNATIATGFCAGLDAISYAADFIRFGRARQVLAGAVEEMCLQTFLGFYKGGFLAGSRGEELSCPFDKRRNGIVFGEGSAVLILEDWESALGRKANIYAEVLGSGMSFNKQPVGLKKAMQLALEKAGANPQDMDYICAGANSSVKGDWQETAAIKEVFSESPGRPRVSSIKSMIGESFSASGALQVAAAVCAIKRQMIPPTINYHQKDSRCDLNYVVNEALSCRVNKVLINTFGPNGCNSSLIIAKAVL